MTTGIVFVSFGEVFDKMTAHCLSYSKAYTSLPIQVITNVEPEKRCKKWADAPDVTFTYIKDITENNREYKTSINKYSIFDNTLYLDSDTIIQKDSFDVEIQKYFESDCDLILNHFITYPMDDNRFQNIYLKAYRKYNCEGKLYVYNGAFIGFKKNEMSDQFFTLWNKYWDDFGRTREMPLLACAINNIKGIKVKALEGMTYSPQEMNEDVTVQHNPNHIRFWRKIGIAELDLPITPYGADDYNFTQL
jgi:hypothetical protein